MSTLHLDTWTVFVAPREMSFKVVARFNTREKEREECERKREKRKKVGANSTIWPPPWKHCRTPHGRISCHRLHRPLSSPAMKQMIKASTRMLWMDRRIHPRPCPAAWPPDKTVGRVSQFPKSDCKLLNRIHCRPKMKKIPLKKTS